MELTPDLREVQDKCAAAARELRAHALAIDADPTAAERLLGSTAFTLNRVDCTPELFRPAEHDSGRPRSCLERIVTITALSRGDAGAILACPGPALAGLVVDLLGTEEQQERFYTRIADGRTWTFFAMTEPDTGSDAANMRTRFHVAEDGGYLLTGHKRYIGNGDRGAIGVVFARTNNSVLGIRAALLELPADGAETMTLPTLGLRGAGLSDMRFDGVRIPEQAMLGSHLRAARRGLWGAMRTFNQVRTQIGGMAVGTAQALHDYVAAELPTTPNLTSMGLRIDATWHTVLDAAAALDADPDRAHVASEAKLAGTRLVTDVAAWALSAAGPGGWAEQPLLEKWARDARGFEFMDGTGNIQRVVLARGYLQENTSG
jgi:alkylation response protein AidB-like acyl-CoA dehydrogenase